MIADLRTFLLADAILSGLVGPRVHENVRPQGGALPAVVLTRAGGPRPHTLAGAAQIVRARVQIDCFGATAAAADAVLEAVAARVLGHAGETGATRFLELGIEDQRSDPDPGLTDATRLHRASLDIYIWHRSA